jgi:tetratricopeptide (TPR) repeat protein
MPGRLRLPAAVLSVSLALALVVVTAAPTLAAERVGLRIGEHPGFSRLVFDWTKPVGSRLEQGPGQATLRFDRPGDLDTARYRADPPPDVTGLEVAAEEGGLTVTLRIPKGAKLRHFESEGNVVLDVLRPETPADAAASRRQSGKRPQTAARTPPLPRSKPKPEPATAAQPAPTAPSPATDANAAGPQIVETRVVQAPVTETAVPPAPSRTVTPAKPAQAPIMLLAKPLDGGTDRGARNTGAGKPSEEKANEGRAELEKPAKSAPVAQGPAVPKPRPKPAAPKTAESTVSAELQAAKFAAAQAKQRPTAAKSASSGPTRPAKPARETKTAKAAGARIVAKPTAEGDAANAKTPAPPVTAGQAPMVIETTPRPARTVKPHAPVALRFAWEGNVSAASYRRGGYLWLVFDRPPPGDLVRHIVKAAPQVSGAEQYELAGATVIRLSVPPTWHARLEREGSVWIAHLGVPTPRAGSELSVEVDAATRPAQVLFHAVGADKARWFTDPVLGDRIAVVPLSVPGQGLGNSREFLQFRALQSSQGVVLQPLSEGIEVAATEKGVRVRHAEGLIVSYGSTLALLQSNVHSRPKGPRLFDLAAWRRGGTLSFMESRQALQRVGAGAPEYRLGPARLELARFYFAHGLASEAAGVLHLRELQDPRLAEDPEARLMIAASEILTEDYDSAAERLYHPALEGEWEADLWRAAMAAVGLDWVAAAAGFDESEALIADYPHPVRSRLRLLAAEAKLGISDTEAADRYLEQVQNDDPSRNEKAQVAFLRGRSLQLQDDTEAAEKLWRQVAASSHLASRTRARLALLDLGLENGSITMEQAAKELDRLRYTWRGDQFEFALLQRLGDIYVASGRYRKGLRALRQAAAYFPESPQSQGVAQRMRDVFAGIYLDGASQGLSPLKALSLYQEFKELTPAGARGDEVIARLADRLIDIDLLDRAAELLDSQVRYRLKGGPKARAGLRLAMVRLLDQKPEAALAALDHSKTENLPENLARDRRYLRVRALADLERWDDAQVLLGIDDSADAMRLRADIFWAREDWIGAAVVLGRLALDAPPADRPLSEAEREVLVNLAVALTLAGDHAKLRELGRTFADAMASGPRKHVFALLIGDLDSDTVKSIAEELAVVSRVRDFMSSYRERLQQADLGQPN